MRVHQNMHAQMSFTSDLWAACKTNRYRWSRGIGGGVLSLSHTIGLMDRLASAELPVVCWCWTEPRGLVVARLNENSDIFIKNIWYIYQHFRILHTIFHAFDNCPCREILCSLHNPDITHRNHCSWKQLFATFAKQSTRAAVAHWAACERKW